MEFEENTEFQDKEISCSDCGAAFTFTAAEQGFYKEKGLTHEPKRCRPCREQRKSRGGGQRPRHGGGHRQAQAGHPAQGNSQPSWQGGTPAWSPNGQPWRGQEPSWRGNAGPRRGPEAGEWRGQESQGSGDAPLFKADFGPTPWSQSGGREGWRGSRGGRSGGSYNSAEGGNSRSGGWRAERPAQRFDAVCSDCGVATQVPFQPDGVQPVYCRGCLPKHKTRRRNAPR